MDKDKAKQVDWNKVGMAFVVGVVLVIIFKDVKY